MNRISAILTAILATAVAPAAIADAECQGPMLDGNTWNLVCSADPGDDEDDYQCDYSISLAYDEGDPDRQEATGSVSPGQSGVIIWSMDVNGEGGGARIVSASIADGSCSQ